jgi:hypothetical protein
MTGGLRLDEERVPVAAWKYPAERGQQQPVVRLQTRASRLPTKNRNLVTEHEDLEFLGSITAAEKHDQLE